MDSAAYSEAFAALFGDGFYETVEKSSPDGSELSTHAKAKREKRQAQIGLASNILGIGAGAQGLYAAGQTFKEKMDGKDRPAPKHRAEPKPKNPASKTLAGVKGKLKAVDSAKKSWWKNPKTGLYMAGGAVGLQGANLAGDLVANRVLSREAKKDVKKSLADYTVDGQIKRRVIEEDSGMPLGAKGQLIRVGMKNKDKIKANSQKVVSVTAPGVKQGTAAVVETTKKVRERYISKALDMAVETEISKVNEEKRQIFGWASVVERDGVPVVDLQGDYISVEEVEKAAYEYVQKSRKGGNQHQRNGEEPVHVSDMIESFVVTPEKKEKLGLPDSVPTGWWVGFKINDDETWDQIKTGKRPQLSIHGRGKRQEL